MTFSILLMTFQEEYLEKLKYLPLKLNKPFEANLHISQNFSGTNLAPTFKI